MFIFGQAGIIVLLKLYTSHKFIVRFFYVAILGYCIDGYVFVLYPAWQVPFGYIFLIIALWLIIKKNKWKNWGICFENIILFIFFLICVFLPISYVFWESWNTIQIIMQSTYPGERFISGGNLSWNSLFRYNTNYILPYLFPVNQAQFELATFMGFFPIGIILFFLNYIRNKEKDRLVELLILLNFIFLFFCFIPWPSIFLHMTFLHMVPEPKLIIAIDFLNLIILLRMLENIQLNVKLKEISFILMLYGTVTAIAVKPYLSDKLYGIEIAIILVVLLPIVFLLFRCKNKIVVFFIISLITGMFVNPISRGVNCIYGSDLASKIIEIAAVDKGKWIVDYMDDKKVFSICAMNSFPIMFGAPTINSTNPYVYWPRWEKLELNAEQKRAINRFCFMNIKISTNKTNIFCYNENKMTPDIVNIELNTHDIEKLNVKYILSEKDLSKLSDDFICFNLYETANGFKIYKIEYPKSVKNN